MDSVTESFLAAFGTTSCINSIVVALLFLAVAQQQLIISFAKKYFVLTLVAMKKYWFCI